MGVLAELRLEETTMELRAGDALVLYTDGLTEARSDHAIFGLARLEAVLSNCVGERASTIVQRIASSEAAFVEDRPRRDDVVVLAVQIPRSANAQVNV